MTTATDLLTTLMQLGTDPASGVYLQPPVDEAAIRHMQVASQRDLGEPVPDEYVVLLRVTNGLQINGAYFKSAEHLVPENLDVLRPEVFVLGNEGSIAEFVFDRRDRRFHTITMGFPDERLASFSSLVELLAIILQEQQVLSHSEAMLRGRDDF